MRVRRTLGGVTTRYLYDGDDLAAELDGSGNRMPHWPGIDQPHSMRTWEGGQNGAIHYYALDLPANTVRGMFNASGGVTHQYGYGPFGEVQSASGSPTNPLRFAARELDATTGLYYFRARWYDPSMGRFISEDPIGLEGGINGYAYALDDPVNLGDPTGLWPCPGPNCLDLVTVVARARGAWHKGFFSSAMDGALSLGGRMSAFDGAAYGSRWQDDGSLDPLNAASLVPSQEEEGWLTEDCKTKLLLTGVQFAADWLALSGATGAYRAWRATSQGARIAGGRAVERVVVTDLARETAGRQLRSETGKMVAGVATQVMTGRLQGDSIDYAIPLWGLGRRSYDATRACLGN